jgi:RNA polymerase sigma factor (sigma-70 family)
MTSEVTGAGPELAKAGLPKAVLQLVTESMGAGHQVDLDDPALMGQIAERNQDALAVLYERHGVACYRLARQVTANGALAEDAVQEAFLGLWRSPASYVASRGSVRSWLLGLTHHKAVDFVRRETSQQRRRSSQAAQMIVDAPADGDPATAAWDGMRAAQVRTALRELPEEQRRALALAYFGGYTQSEISQMTGVPLGTVKTRTFSALRRLRLRLAPLAALSEEGSS